MCVLECLPLATDFVMILHVVLVVSTYIIVNLIILFVNQ